MDTNSSTTPTSRDDLRGLDRDIEALNTVLSMLKRRRDLMRLEQSPMQHLPDDVLEEIFVNCLPTTRNARPFVSESPLLLTVVCRKWRAVALSAPRLWSTLHISTSFNFNAKKGPTPYFFLQDITPEALPKDRLLELHTARTAGLDQWLCRSGALPLLISLHSPLTRARNAAVEIGETDAFESQTLDVVARCAHRIRSLEVNVFIDVIIQLCKSISQHSPCGPSNSKLPLLQHLRIKSFNLDLNSNDTMYTTRSLSAISLLYGSESLREVSIHLIVRHNMRNYWKELPVNITVLMLHDPIEVSRLHHVLRRLKRLERAKFRPSDVHQDIDDPIFLPSLKTLSIYASKESLDAFCRPLNAPNLSSLRLQVHPREHMHTLAGSNVLHWQNPPPPVNPNTSDSIEHMCNFLTRCISLQILTINKHTLSGDEMGSILFRVSRIKSLVFSGCADNQLEPSPRPPPRSETSSILPERSLHLLLKQETVSEMTGDVIPLEEPLLPHLTSFTWNQDLPDVPIDFVVEFVISRLHGPHDAVREEASPGPMRSRRCAYTEPLKEINIKLFDPALRLEVEDAIIRHVELNTNLKRGVDFNLDVSVYPYVEECVKPVPQYFIPVGFRNLNNVPYMARESVGNTVDGLNVYHDVTWNFVDI